MNFRIIILIIAISASFLYSKTVKREYLINKLTTKNERVSKRTDELIINIDFEGDLSEWSQDESNGWEINTTSFNSASHSYNSPDISNSGVYTVHSLYSQNIELPELNNGEIIDYSFALNCDMPDYIQEDIPSTPDDESQLLADHYTVSIRNINAPSEWHVSDFNPFNANNWWCGNEDANGYFDNWVQYLDTPSFTVPSSGVLSADMSWGIEDPAGASVAGTCTDGWDQANVQISIDNGNTWIVIEGSTPYDFQCGYGTVYNGFEGSPGWGGNKDWHNVTFDLTQYEGETAIIRFAFYSDPAYSKSADIGSNDYCEDCTGFQVDNIAVNSAFTDTAESEEHMYTSGVTWIDQFFDYCIEGHPGYNGWDTYDPEDAWNGNVFMDLRAFSGQTIQFRFQTFYDGDHFSAEVDSPQGEGLYIDDLKLFKKNASGTRPKNLTGTYIDESYVKIQWDDLNFISTDSIYAYDNNIFPIENMLFSGDQNDDLWIGTEIYAAGTSTVNSIYIYVHPGYYQGTIGGFSSYGLNYNTEPDYELIIPSEAEIYYYPNGGWADIEVDWTFNGNFIIAQKLNADYPVGYDPTSENTSHSKIFLGSTWENWSDVVPVLNEEPNATWQDGAWGLRGKLSSTNPGVSYNVYRSTPAQFNGDPYLIKSGIQESEYQDNNLISGNYTYKYTVSATYPESDIYPNGTESAVSDALIINADYLSIQDQLELPETLTLKQNFPNPFNPTTIISFFNPEISNMTLTIYNVLGQRIHHKSFKNLLPGDYEYPFNGMKLNSGIYIYTLEDDSGIKLSKKMLLIK